MKHKIATSHVNSNHLNVTIAKNETELKTTLETIKADKTQRLWWFSDELEQKKEKKS
jgi:hypothetical protein